MYPSRRKIIAARLTWKLPCGPPQVKMTSFISLEVNTEVRVLEICPVFSVVCFVYSWLREEKQQQQHFLVKWLLKVHSLWGRPWLKCIQQVNISQTCLQIIG